MATTANTPDDKRLLREIRRIIREEVARAFSQKAPDYSNTEVLDKNGAAQLLKISVSKLNHNLHKYPHFRDGGRVLFEKNTLLAAVIH